jgi:hypothetical protein
MTATDPLQPLGLTPQNKSKQGGNMIRPFLLAISLVGTLLVTIHNLR